MRCVACSSACCCKVARSTPRLTCSRASLAPARGGAPTSPLSAYLRASMLAGVLSVRLVLRVVPSAAASSLLMLTERVRSGFSAVVVDELAAPDEASTAPMPATTSAVAPATAGVGSQRRLLRCARREVGRCCSCRAPDRRSARLRPGWPGSDGSGTRIAFREDLRCSGASG